MTNRLPRRIRARQVQALRELEYTHREIAAELGIAVQTSMSYVKDPDGSKARERHERKKRLCACGRAMIAQPQSTHCKLCAIEVLRLLRTRWTRERIIGGLQRYYFEHGAPPTVHEVNEKNVGHYPTNQATKRLFGSWNAAVEAAGFPPYKRGSGRRRKP